MLTRPALAARRDARPTRTSPFAALVIGAVLLEARHRKRGYAVLVLLAVAGLLRPEAWLLSGLYVLYIWRDGAARAR